MLVLGVIHPFFDFFQFQDFLLSMHALIYYEHDGPSEKWQSDLKEEQSQPCEFLVPPGDFPLGGA